MIRVLSFIVLFVYMAALPARANTPPLPQNKKEVIGSFDEKIAERKHQKEALQNEMQSLEASLSETRSELVRVSRSVQSNEKELGALEVRISDLESRKGDIETTLEKDREAIAKLVLALERIRRVPPEALIARPGAPLKTAQSAMLMRDIIPAIQAKATKLKSKLEELETVTADLMEKKETAEQKAVALNKEHKALSALLEKREQLYASTQTDLEDQKRHVQKLAQQARNLRDLVSRLDEDRSRKKTIDTVRKAALSQPEVPLPPISSGSVQLPLSGIIRTRYHETDNIGAKSQGIHIEGRSMALVVAPISGVVRYAGDFKNHGRLVVIEHSDGYHSLVAGLEKLDTVVGQTVSTGEPLGMLPQTGRDERPVLYYELRYRGKPVNPSRKFAQLG